MRFAQLSRLLAVLAAAASVLTLSVLATSPKAAAAGSMSHSTSLVSNDSHLFATAELGWTGNGQFSSGVLRARSGAPGPWENFNLDYVHDWDSSAPADEVLIYSNAAHNYVSAEFSWPGLNRGILHVRPGSTTVGPWETFFLDRNSDGTVSLSVDDSSGTRYYVSAEEGWTGNGFATLRARSTSVGPWEKFVANDRFVSGYDDYPAAWRNPARDSFANLWGFNRECVSFAAWKIYENGGGTQVPGGTGVPSDWASHSINVDQVYGDAGDWAGHASANGVPVNGTPTPGSIAQWNRNSDGGQLVVGHVAIVTAVFPDGSIDLAQYNLRENGLFSTLYMPRGGATDTSVSPGFFVSFPDNFIHFNGF